MRLSSIEIKGFKSFADKTVIHFNENITGVVGPNGCGKSNIVDAVRWVLGEQKASTLRSTKMENLIFNGSKKRKASGLAEVSLTFENTKNVLPTEYSTVTISRHYFRNGDSEYRLNDVPCRLKDITGLFMDTGIGPDSYAIIELGMVDDLLNDKDNSRRRLFEQAAGIEKYKTRKKETFSKLTSTQNDLDRVEDLLFEIQGNLKTLESQARRAQRYYKMREDYKTLSIELAVYLLSDQKAAYKTINGQIEQESDKQLKVETEIQKLEASIQQNKKANLGKEQAVSATQKRLNEHVAGIREQENNRNLLNENIRLTKERLERLHMEKDQASSQVKTVTSKIGSLEQKLKDQTEKVTVLQQRVAEQARALESKREAYGTAREELESAQSELTTTEKRIYELEKKQAINQVLIDNLSTEIEKGSEQEKQGKAALDKLNKTLGNLQEEVDKREKELSALREKEQNLQDEIASNDKLIDKIRQELDQENRHLDAKRNEYDLLKNLIDNLEGFPESIKFLRKEVKHTKHAPLLSDVISCPDEYRPAIENYLEPYLNYYVVNTWQEAKECIQVLSDAAKGRANFFILSEFGDYKPASHIRSDNALAAMEVLEVESKYQPLAAFLLDNVYFVDDIDTADTYISDQSSTSPVFLTRSGKFIRSRFALSGGAVGLFEGKKLGRKKSLEKLSKAIKKHEARTVDISKQLTSLQKKQQALKQSTLPKEIEETREALNAARQEIASIKASISHAQQSIGTASDKFKTSMERTQEVEKENKGLEQELAQLAEDQKQWQTSTAQRKEKYETVSAELAEMSNAYNQENLAFHQQENLKKSIQQELNFNQEQLNQAHQRISESDSEAKTLTETLKTNGEKVTALEDALKVAYKEKETIEAELVKVEEVYYQSRGEIDELEEKMKELHRQKEQANLLVNNLKEKLNDLKLDLASMKERMSVEFKVDINELLNREPNPDYNLEELSEKVDKLKNKLDKFGEINPMAVEAFNEMKERHDFISSQKEDLITAKDNLLKTIEEIDATAKDQFMASFEAVQRNFEEVFRTLFTEEDNCALKLSDPDDPLESKIEILAQPKGKRPLTINQLSGGEKTLTAIALLFSLYLIKPAPFCVFDEVDAPLDDVNIDKFTNIIRQFSKDSQFIIVTHNKQTMSAVDVIYGVTMLEEGVSKVVPVDFRQLEAVAS